MKLTSLSIKQLVLLFLIFLTFINVISVATIFLSMSNNSVAVDVSGRNRMLSQRMVLFARLYIDGDPKAAEVCKTAMTLHDASVLAMKHGGEAPGIAGKFLSPAEGEAADYLDRVTDMWAKYKQHMQRVLEQPAYTDSTLTRAVTDTAHTGAAPLFTETRIRVENPQVKASIDFLSNNATAILTVNDDLVKAYVKQAKETERTIYWLLLAGVALSMAVLALSYRTLDKILFSPLNAIAHSSTALAEGDYTQHIVYTWQNELSLLAASLNVLFNKLKKASLFVDEFGKGNYSFEIEEFKTDANFQNDSFIRSLIDTQTMLKEADEKNKQRNWVNTGFARFADVLRNHHIDVPQLGRTVIIQLTKYLDVNQGGIFMLNDSDQKQPFLELVGCYAYAREKFVTKRIEIGEGLAGEVYLEGATRYLLEIPEGYLSITSGLGQADPKSILIVPLKLNEQVLGVIELASFTPFEPYQIDFVEKIGESIAATISSMKTNEQTRRLLEVAQQQAEEMRAQEEEMRQNTEELEATQEEMHRKEMELTGQLAAVNATLATIEFDLQGCVLTANPIFLSTMKYTLEEIKGKHHSMFVDKIYAQSDTYTQFWNKLKAGIALTDEFSRVAADGSVVWLNATYTPVRNRGGEVVKVIKLASNITAYKLKNPVNSQ
jgi:PAS domain S-box-containing protein